ncbi:zinc finger protein DPF3-like isoform X2 [Tachysurus vachellii]|uniref:zinc finger protein DPF3-like isoform X2 n=1 Tax=Tachysurus vachellii TaxID=175792 RepID=UPI00296ADF70|nr:zinc finger protein DPF3-like isoform X2 [Tachysurus vachellii]
MAAVIQNPLNALGDQFYREAIEHCRSYNARLCAERSVRLPFLDSQTGVAQNNCYIWMERHHRGPGLAAGQMYSYPARCWRKKRRLHTSMDSSLHLYGLNIDNGLTAKDTLPTPSTTLEALLRGDGLDKRNSTREEDLLEIQRVLEADANEDGYHDDEDFEVDIPKRKHRGKGRGRGSGRRRTDHDDQDKPYICEICGKRYRNRTGLSYHYGHSHIADKEGPQARDQEPSQSPAINHRPHSRKHQKSPEEVYTLNRFCKVCQVHSDSKLKDGKCSKCSRLGMLCRERSCLVKEEGEMSHFWKRSRFPETLFTSSVFRMSEPVKLRKPEKHQTRTHGQVSIPLQTLSLSLKKKKKKKKASL